MKCLHGPAVRIFHHEEQHARRRRSGLNGGDGGPSCVGADERATSAYAGITSIPLSSSLFLSPSALVWGTIVSTLSRGANRTNEFLSIFVASNSRMIFCAMDIMSFFVSPCAMSGVLAPFSVEKLFTPMKALSTARPESIPFWVAPCVTVQ